MSIRQPRASHRTLREGIEARQVRDGAHTHLQPKGCSASTAECDEKDGNFTTIANGQHAVVLKVNCQ